MPRGKPAQGHHNADGHADAAPASGRAGKRQRSVGASELAPQQQHHTRRWTRQNRAGPTDDAHVSGPNPAKASGQCHTEPSASRAAESPRAAAGQSRSRGADVSAAAPPARKRQRVERARVPPALPSEDLHVCDRESGPMMRDTEEGHYDFTVGDNLTPRFKIMRKFGEGTFGRVVECWDRRRGDYVAVKIIRNVDKYRDAAMVELQVLYTMASHDPHEMIPVVRLLEWFDYRGHVCMVFERLGPSLYDCLRRNNYKPFPLPMARGIVCQLLRAVEFMHRLTLVHTDLKPENVLFLDQELVNVAPPPGSKLARKLPPRDEVRLIDFGSATFDEDYHSTVVCTRHYRAPEIMLGVGWSHPADLWSLGCILVELLTGEALFQTHDNLEHLAMMERAVGPMPTSLARAAEAGAGGAPVRALFTREHRLTWPEGAAGRKSLRAVSKVYPLRQHLERYADDSVRPHLDDVADLLSRMMDWRAERRCTALEALDHPFFDDPDLLDVNRRPQHA